MTHLNPAFNNLVPFTPHPAFAPLPIYNNTRRETHISPDLESRFILHLIRKYEDGWNR